MATKDFITYSPNTGNKNQTISVSASKNTGAARSTRLNITGKGISKTIFASQKKGDDVIYIIQFDTYNHAVVYESEFENGIVNGGTIELGRCPYSDSLIEIIFDIPFDSYEYVGIPVQGYGVDCESPNPGIADFSQRTNNQMDETKWKFNFPNNISCTLILYR